MTEERRQQILAFNKRRKEQAEQLANALAENETLTAARDALQARLDRIREATTIDGTVTLSKLKKMLETIREAFND